MKARWVVCYDCRGITNSQGSRDMYTFMTDLGQIGSTPKEPPKGYFRTGKDIEVEIRD